MADLLTDHGADVTLSVVSGQLERQQILTPDDVAAEVRVALHEVELAMKNVRSGPLGPSAFEAEAKKMGQLCLRGKSPALSRVNRVSAESGRLV
jgi:hypothetical protein